MVKYLKYNSPFTLESGEVLPEINIAYCTYGELNEQKDNVIWICHALTANADAAEWWPGLVGKGKLFDPENYCIICANMLGSCYGSTGPRSNNPVSGKQYGRGFPLITIRDMVKAHELLRSHLGIEKIKLSIGGSMGGQQVLEWAIMQPERFDHICVLAANAFHSPWGVAFNEAQRMAIEADPTLYDEGPEAGRRGLEAARAIAMLSYRNYRTYLQTQSEEHDGKIDDFRASSYQRYQGLKLHKRFDVLAYLSLSKSMDSHNVGRRRGGLETALQQIKAKALIIGIKSDVLFPVEEQVQIANEIPYARLELIESLYGHDGFLIENDQISVQVSRFLDGIGYNTVRTKYRLRRGLDKSVQISRTALPGTEHF